MRHNRTRQVLAVPAATAVLLLTAACGSESVEEPADSSQSDSPSESDATEQNGSYQAGTYEANGTYAIPSGGRSNVDVSVTLTESGEISDVEVTPKSGGTSAKYQKQFAGGIAGEVVGVNIDELDVSKVSGSSLTSGGFAEAIEQIKSEAKA